MEMNHQTQSLPISKKVITNNSAMKLALILGAGVLLLEPSIAAAAPWDAAVKNIADTLTGTLGRTIAIIAVVVLGFMAMAGKLEWMNAIKVIVGIVIVFSASQIINWISPQANVVATIASGSQVQCNAQAHVWIPASVLVSDAAGVIAPAESPKCVEAASALQACTATVSGFTAAAAAAGSRPIPTYYTYVAGALICS